MYNRHKLPIPSPLTSFPVHCTVKCPALNYCFLGFLFALLYLYYFGTPLSLSWVNTAKPLTPPFPPPPSFLFELNILHRQKVTNLQSNFDTTGLPRPSSDGRFRSHCLLVSNHRGSRNKSFPRFSSTPFRCHSPPSKLPLPLTSPYTPSPLIVSTPFFPIHRFFKFWIRWAGFFTQAPGFCPCFIFFPLSITHSFCIV